MTRLFFTEELKARMAVNDCFELGYYGYVLAVYKTNASGIKCCINVHNDAVNTIKLRYGSFIK